MALVAEKVEETLLVIGEPVGFQALEFGEVVGRGGERQVQIAGIHRPAALKFGEALFDRIRQAVARTGQNLLFLVQGAVDLMRQAVDVVESNR